MVKNVGTMLLITLCAFGTACGQNAPSKASGQSSEPPPSRPAAAGRSAASQTVPEAVVVIPVKEGENGFVRVVYPLGNLPASYASNTLQSLFNAESGKNTAKSQKEKLVIVPDAISNCLLLSGPTAAVDEVKRLLIDLDKPRTMVRLDVQINEQSADKGKKPPDAGSAESKTANADASKKTADKTEEGNLLLSAEVVTLDNQPAYIKIGRQEPHITGVSQGPPGRTSNSYTTSSVGSTINLTPRAGPNGIVSMVLGIQDSRSGPMDEGVLISSSDKGEVRAQNVETLDNNTTLRLQDGQPMTISSTTTYGKIRKITVTAHIIYPAAEKTN